MTPSGELRIDFCATSVEVQEGVAKVLECSGAVEMREREREMWRSESEEAFWMTLRDVG